MTFTDTDIIADTEQFPASPYFFQPFHLMQALEWSLVLNALAIEHILSKEDDGWMLKIDLELLSRGENEIAIYQEEVKNHLPKSVEPVEYYPVSKILIISFFLALLLFHIFVNLSGSDFYYDKGMLSTQKILDGEWWRAITALTLHADFQHFAMNAVFGSIFIYVLSYMTGTRFALSLTIISGFYGNLINAFLHKYDFRSLGLSTAVFGTLGLLLGMQLFGKFRLEKSAQKVVLISTLLFFSLFGIGTERVDTGAHLFGLLSGVVIGGVTSFWDVVRYKGFNWFNHILFACTMTVLVICWLI